MATNEYSISDKGLDAWKLRDALNNGKTLCGGVKFSCTIKRVTVQGAEVYEMNGPTGRHAISADYAHTDEARLWKHWMGYKNNAAAQS